MVVLAVLLRELRHIQVGVFLGAVFEPGEGTTVSLHKTLFAGEFPPNFATIVALNFRLVRAPSLGMLSLGHARASPWREMILKYLYHATHLRQSQPRIPRALFFAGPT